MIKRRFFKAEHGEKDEASSDSSSSSSDSEAGATEQSEDDVVADPEENSESEDDGTVAEPKEESESEASSSSSGYESEDSSANVIDGYSSDDRKTHTGIETHKKQSNATADEESLPDDIPDCILKCKSVYKCRICPRIICLTEETMRAHLSSKRHARSEKLMKENRLKVMLNSDGEIENLDEETHAERHARTVALAQGKLTKKNKGRQRQRKRLKKRKEGNAASMEKTTSKTKSPPKKRLKNEK
ncbi:PREDICTED: lisH domain-containing protein C1711.05-like isoform X2 [Populus euphratica]|uniref:LisH domain-containing protein C1711.05-like isoform X2 n=1 Tax=Populus euphratica TaxID=75702 RepID=A0AAJ6UTK0_POPEU|nr:PREDICTED: lisH domain-containing protein C1711.05-like isoform X2 [Populus euphratica]